MYRNAPNLKIEQQRITDGSNGSSHQAVSWTIHSPLIADPIHITGVYVSPSEGEVHTLTQQDHYPHREIHVYAGNFNAHVAEEREAHTTLQERSTIPSRVGDCPDDTYPRHMMHLQLQMQEYPPSSGAASYLECSTLRLF